jgi:hypothetical protein
VTRCHDIAELVTAYVDGDLDDARASAIRGHVRSCSGCAALVEAEVAVRDAAEALDPAIDPPASLWDRIEARIANEEIHDSRRSALWLWWQRARPQVFLGAGAAAVAGLVLAVWIARSNEGDSHDPTARAPGELAAVGPHGADGADVPASTASTPSSTIDEQLVDDILRAEKRYRDTIAELERIAASERESWDADLTAAYDARIAELDAIVRRERAAAAGGLTPESRDTLFAAYRVQISFMNEVTVTGELLQ